jgi:hypothetical protein
MMMYYVDPKTLSSSPQPRLRTRGSTALRAFIIFLCIYLAAILWTWGWHVSYQIKRVIWEGSEDREDWNYPDDDVFTLEKSRGAWWEEEEEDSGFNWLTAPTHKHLQYAPCYPSWGEFQCARLELPLDYWNGTTNATLSLAVIRKPAAVPITDPRYAGPLIVNPGGPGGSGIEYVVGAWKRLRHSVDSLFLDDPDGKFYDILSFDPRGVGFTAPNVQCFADYGLGKGWALRIMEEGVLGASDATFGRLWSMAIARAKSCALPSGDGKDVKPYATTAHAARDMLELVEYHGQWREAEAKRLINCRCCSMKQVSKIPGDSQIPEELKYKPGEEKILYSGGLCSQTGSIDSEWMGLWMQTIIAKSCGPTICAILRQRCNNSTTIVHELAIPPALLQTLQAKRQSQAWKQEYRTSPTVSYTTRYQ